MQMFQLSKQVLVVCVCVCVCVRVRVRVCVCVFPSNVKASPD